MWVALMSWLVNDEGGNLQTRGFWDCYVRHSPDILLVDTSSEELRTSGFDDLLDQHLHGLFRA